MGLDFAWKSYSSKPVKEKVEVTDKEGNTKMKNKINFGALGLNILGNGTMAAYGLLSLTPDLPDADNKANTFAKDFKGKVNDSFMASRNPILMGVATTDKLLNKLGWQATGTDSAALNLGSNIGNTALASTPIVGAIAGHIFGTKTAEKYTSDLLSGSLTMNRKSDADGLFGAKGIVFQGGKAKELTDNENIRSWIGDQQLLAALRDFTAATSNLYQKAAEMKITGGPSRITNFGVSSAKQGTVLQFTKRTISKHKVKKQLIGGQINIGGQTDDTSIIKQKTDGNFEIELERTPTYEEWVKNIPKEYVNEKNYDLELLYNTAIRQKELDSPELWDLLQKWVFAVTRPTLEERDYYLNKVEKDENGKNYYPYHTGSVVEELDENGEPTGNYIFLKLGLRGENDELKGELNWYDSDEANDFKKEYELDSIGHRYYYKLKNPKKLKGGGKVNVIPEGALHKNKHNLDKIDKDKFGDSITTKGIPVIVEGKDGEVILLAEVERQEIIFRLEVTKKLEELSKKHTDEAAIEAGKLLVYEILYNTEDKTNNMI